MNKWKELLRKCFFLTAALFVFVFVLLLVTFPQTDRPSPKPARNLQWVSNSSCPLHTSGQTITPLKNTKHLLVSAYMDQRVEDFDVRIISIFKRDSSRPLHCLFCCTGHLASTITPAKIKEHAHFFFPFAAVDILCQLPQNCKATHVSLLTDPASAKTAEQIWLPIRNQRTNGKEEKKINFTVCISTLFEFNNALQYAQALEMYRLLGVDRVVIYNTSCGPELDRLLQSYSQEGFVELVPWPINKYLKPSRGCLFSQSGGDVHYFGRIATLNECIYRSMERSRYVLLNDIDEIIMPYQHNSLAPLMDMLQQQHPNVGVFIVESHIYHNKPFEEDKGGLMPQWRGVPGFNVLEHIYKLEPNSATVLRKLIVQPRMVEQTSVYLVPQSFGEEFLIPPELCRVIHSTMSNAKIEPLEKIRLDTRLWDFSDELIPNVNNALRRAGLLSIEGQN